MPQSGAVCSSPELSALKIVAVMTPAPVTIDEDKSVADARAILRERRIRHLPVVHEGRLTGILSDRDTRLVSLMPRIAYVAVADVMTRNPLTVTEDTPVLEALSKMAARKLGCLVITRRTGEVSGIFTTQDALALLLGERGLNLPVQTGYSLIEEGEEECLWE